MTARGEQLETDLRRIEAAKRAAMTQQIESLCRCVAESRLVALQVQRDVAELSQESI